MNTYIVLVDRVYRETAVVTARSEEEAIEKVMDDDYDDVIDTEPMSAVEGTAVVELQEEDVEEYD